MVKNPSTVRTEDMYVYAVVDPRNPDEWRYIGVTNNPQRRLKQHLREKGNTYKNRWVNSVQRDGLVPQLVILKCVIGEHASMFERTRIIIAEQLGFRLTNATTGGESSYHLSDEAKKKIGDNSRKCLTGRKMPPFCLCGRNDDPATAGQPVSGCLGVKGHNGDLMNERCDAIAQSMTR